jgi:predicted amidohydrolase YtcJ
MGGGIAVQNRIAFQEREFLERYGAERAEQAPPIRRMLEMGIPVGAGTDMSRVSSYNPWLCLEWLVTGRGVGGTPLLGARTRLDRETALGSGPTMPGSRPRRTARAASRPGCWPISAC